MKLYEIDGKHRLLTLFDLYFFNILVNIPKLNKSNRFEFVFVLFARCLVSKVKGRTLGQHKTRVLYFEIVVKTNIN